MVPAWLHGLAWASLVVAAACALTLAVDEIRHPQKMWIMNLVWPLTALYGSAVALWGYFRTGRGMAKDARQGQERQQGRKKEQPSKEPTGRQVGISASHCGAGCMLADIVGENLVFAAGWSLLGEKLYADYAVTLGLAWLFGVGFQYFSIQPMRHLGIGEALVAAARADTLSIVFYQIGMYGWMAIVYFVLFPHPHLEPDSPVFWFMMQIGMGLGYVTTLPMNRWLLRSGIKEAMG